MCGIFGITDTRLNVPDTGNLEASRRTLSHRGPDSSGIHVEDGIGLVHTRLSLLDLSERGRQPFFDPEKHYVLVYNGEIYNFKTLREELEHEGVVFRTGTDTEVLLYGLIRWGADVVLSRLEGMFAFAFFDRRKRTLLLARDRYGIKPLFVYEDDDVFLFASEIKAMKPWVQLEANPFSISSYLLGFGGPTKDHCFFGGVRIVPPGGVVRLELGKKAVFGRHIEFADLIDLDEQAELSHMSPTKIVDRLDECLQHAVRQMLFADAPVGALCSGGVDSSLLMAIAARYHDNLAIFHADVVGPWSEYDAARTLARHLQLDLNKVEVREQDFIDGIPEVTYHYDHPFHYHPNSVPFLAVSKLVREHKVKAVLSGEGADECFLGYPGIAQEPVIHFCRQQLEQMRKLLQRIPFFEKFLWTESPGSPELVVGMLSGFEREMEKERLEQEYAERQRSAVDLNLRTMLWLSYHLRTLLHRNDCLGMAASIEARFPVLDERITKFAINLPHKYKIRFSPRTWERAHPFFRDKWVLRKVADRYVPRELSRRKKLGFQTNAFSRMTISRDYFRGGSFFRSFFRLTEGQADYLFEHADQNLKERMMLLEVWGRVSLGGDGIEETSADLRRHVSI